MVAWKTLTLTAIAAAMVSAADTCGPNNKCPKDKPCCDQYGDCGTGMSCLGGCDIQGSFNLDSCMPMPVCKSGKSKFNNIGDIGKIQTFNGDSEKYPWVYTGKLDNGSDGSVLITMPKNSVGSVLSTTHYLWYGNLKATMKTSRGDGVITDFILMSNVKDEIDYEFVGNDLTHAQTNYYFQGVLAYDKQSKAQISDSYENYHTYEVDWTEDAIQWKIDGDVVRELKKSDTWDESSKTYKYPQTPARLQLGIWPGGDKNQGEGTIEWAGGEIDWDSEDIKKDGYYSFAVKEVDVTCYDPPSDTKKSGSKSYKFTNTNGLGSDVEITDDDHILHDMKNSGNDNTSQSIPDATGVQSKTKSSKKSKSTSESIPDASEETTSKSKSTKKSEKTTASSKETGSAAASKSKSPSATGTSSGGSSSSSGSGSGSGGSSSTTSSSDDGDVNAGAQSSDSDSGADATTASSNNAIHGSGASFVVPSLMTIMGFAYALL